MRFNLLKQYGLGELIKNRTDVNFAKIAHV
jgi:hypothetical protein